MAQCYRITDKHIIFWGSFLSNFEPCNIEYGGHKFTSSEQLFMWSKAIYFKDEKIADEILRATTPKEAKTLGRLVSNYVDEDWNVARENYMRLAVFQKFVQNNELRKQLKKLYNLKKTFVEGSPYDTIWGIGIFWEDPDADDETKWRGQNLLGKIINEVCEKLF